MATKLLLLLPFAVLVLTLSNWHLSEQTALATLSDWQANVHVDRGQDEPSPHMKPFLLIRKGRSLAFAREGPSPIEMAKPKPKPPANKTKFKTWSAQPKQKKSSNPFSSVKVSAKQRTSIKEKVRNVVRRGAPVKPSIAEETPTLPPSPFDYSMFEGADGKHINTPCENVSAIVVVHNEALLLEESLASAADCVGEVIVIDHGSTDESFAIIQRVAQHFSNVVPVRLTRDRNSLGMAKNAAVDRATKTFLLRWDGDFVAYGRAEMASLCRLAEQTSADAVHYAIPHVGGDMRHSAAWASASNEVYMFRRGAIRFTLSTHFDDQLSPVATAPLRHTYAEFDAATTAPGVSVHGLTTFPSPFMLHFAYFKNAEKLLSRPLMSRFEQHRRALIKSKKHVPSFFNWLFVRSFKRAPRSQDEIAQYREILIEKFCSRPREFLPFDETRWPHTPYLLSIVKKKMAAFSLVPVDPKAKNSTAFYTLVPGCNSSMIPLPTKSH